jgi:hypothetical protein
LLAVWVDGLGFTGCLSFSGVLAFCDAVFLLQPNNMNELQAKISNWVFMVFLWVTINGLNYSSIGLCDNCPCTVDKVTLLI